MRDDIARNLTAWDADSDDYQRRHAGQLNRWDRLAWGVWDIPESQVGALGPVAGLEALELGCGGGQFGIRVARRGARVVGLDLSRRQLQHAARHAREQETRFPLVCGDAERLPFASARFDLVFCDHGATTFTDPTVTVPEVARVLRPGGRFVFNHATPLIGLCRRGEGLPGRVLESAYFEIGRRAMGLDAGVDWQLPHGEWIRLFVASGFEVENLIELRPDEGAGTTYGDYVSREWARDFPAEEIWCLRKSAPPVGRIP